MLRTKYRSKLRVGNLKREDKRKTLLYLEKLSWSQVRASRGRITERQGVPKGGGIEVDNATIVTNLTNIDTKIIDKGKKLRVTENILALTPTVLNRPGTSKGQPNEKTITKPAKNIQDKGIQMRQNLIVEDLQEEEDDDSLADVSERRSRYILVGWDNFRSRILLCLLILLLVWASIYFPLIGT